MSVLFGPSLQGLRGFPGGSEGKKSACHAGDPGLIPGSGRSPWRKKWQPTPVFLPGESHRQKSLAGYSPGNCKELDTIEQLTLPGAQTVKNLPTMWETQVRSLSQEDCLEKGMQPTPVFLPGESHGQRSLEGYSPWGHKESDMTEQLTLFQPQHKVLPPAWTREPTELQEPSVDSAHSDGLADGWSS